MSMPTKNAECSVSVSRLKRRMLDVLRVCDNDYVQSNLFASSFVPMTRDARHAAGDPMHDGASQSRPVSRNSANLADVRTASALSRLASSAEAMPRSVVDRPLRFLGKGIARSATDVPVGSQLARTALQAMSVDAVSADTDERPRSQALRPLRIDEEAVVMEASEADDRPCVDARPRPRTAAQDYRSLLGGIAARALAVCATQDSDASVGAPMPFNIFSVGCLSATSQEAGRILQERAQSARTQDDREAALREAKELAQAAARRPNPVQRAFEPSPAIKEAADRLSHRPASPTSPTLRSRTQTRAIRGLVSSAAAMSDADSSAALSPSISSPLTAPAGVGSTTPVQHEQLAALRRAREGNLVKARRGGPPHSAATPTSIPRSHAAVDTHATPEGPSSSTPGKFVKFSS